MAARECGGSKGVGGVDVGINGGTPPANKVLVLRKNSAAASFSPSLLPIGGERPKSPFGSWLLLSSFLGLVRFNGLNLHVPWAEEEAAPSESVVAATGDRDEGKERVGDPRGFEADLLAAG